MAIKFTSDKSTLLSLITPAMYASSNKSTLPALEGLLFTLKGSTLTVCGYDLEKGIKAESTVFGREDGKVVLNSVKISGIIKNLPEGDIFFECDEKNTVSISAGESRFALHGIDSSVFPSIPELMGENTTKIKADVLRDLITSTNHAVATTDSRPVFMGEQFRIENGDLTIVAADYCRMAVKSAKGCVTSEKEQNTFVVPGKTLNDLIRLSADVEDDIEMQFTRKYVIFRIDNVMMFSRLLEGEFLDYQTVIPVSGKTCVTIDRQAFLESVERASLLVDEKLRTPLRFKFEGDNLIIHCSTQIGKINDVVKIEHTGDDMEIGFNNKYILDALRACRDEKIQLIMTSPHMGMVIRPAEPKEDSDYTYLVLPLRLKD
ncbi:MAG: DNA polymerase III subunit beta [Clostridia bacterium]|nr:DNA polymerase III subunit beta [Clostridia bacterium]